MPDGNYLLEQFHFSNPDKILYPEQGITKLQLANFYFDIQDWILPYVINRPLTFVRCPLGRQKKCFFQKHILEDTAPDLYPINIKEKQGVKPYPFIKNVKGLLACVQMGVLELHLWNCKIDKVEKPDMFMFDLDPGEDVEWKEVIHAAYHLRDVLEDLNLQSFVKTSGGKGLHIVVPIKRQYYWDEIKDYSHQIVRKLVDEHPTKYIGVMTKSKRIKKIFIDYLRNQRSATAIAPYSTRARHNAPVATPLDWRELSPKIKSDTFNVNNLYKRLARLDHDPWENFFKIKQTVKMK